MQTTRKRGHRRHHMAGKPSTRKLRVVKSINDEKEWFIGTAGLMTSKAKWFAQPELNLLEVNSTFYRLPGPRQLNAWKAFPEHISFVLKMSKYVTHIKRLKEPEEGVARFLEAVAPLNSRTKGFLVQLPPTFVYNDVNMARIDHLYSLLPSKTKDIFVEFRDPSWHNTQVYEWFARKKWVIAGTWINKTAGTKYMGNMPGGMVMPGPKTTDACYVRLHGSKGFRGSYSETQLQQLKSEILSRGCKQNFVVFNNTFFPNRSQSCTKNGVELKFAAVCNAVSLGELV